MKTQRIQLTWLIVGDLLTAFIVTGVGFLDHYGNLQGWRWLSTFLPVAAAWLAIAPWLGVYRVDLACSLRQIWRPVLAAIFSAPLAATLRGFWLNGAILPLFVLVLGLTNGLGFAIWRLAWIGINRWIKRRTDRHG